MRARSIDRRIVRRESGDREELRYVVRDPRVSRRALTMWASPMPPCAASPAESSRCPPPPRWSEARLAIFPPPHRHRVEALQGTQSERCRWSPEKHPARVPWQKGYYCPPDHHAPQTGVLCCGASLWVGRLIVVLESLAHPLPMSRAMHPRDAEALAGTFLAIKTSFLLALRDGEAVFALRFRHRNARALRRYLRSVELRFGFRGSFERPPHNGRYRERVWDRVFRQQGMVLAWTGEGQGTWGRWVARSEATWSTERGVFVLASRDEPTTAAQPC